MFIFNINDNGLLQPKIQSLLLLFVLFYSFIITNKYQRW